VIPFRKHLDLLGMRVRDRVTGYTGVVASISFDLYGCVQAIVNPGLDKDGKPMDSGWFDVGRLEVADPTPVMDRPSFDWTPEAIASGRKGPAEKPKRGGIA
jgi:hypothetical protein